MSQNPAAADEAPTYFIKKDFPIPTPWCGAGSKTEFRCQMEDMPVSKTDALVFRNNGGRPVNKLHGLISSYRRQIEKQCPGREYVVRTIMLSGVKTIAVWRVA